ncbi:H(+)/Cl(-) exchange transporter 7-like isoform X2 [Sycon ciliatum]|uniref:H(+)/Cl(-) exchange transporter 7-like isoform X2 n=1 Tax=Sycon ciliatum TaxID=27933 RepID=UPI0020AB2686
MECGALCQYASLPEYESRDYEEINSKLARQEALEYDKWQTRLKSFYRWVMCFMIGAVTAMVYMGVNTATEHLGDAKFDLLEQYVDDGKLAAAFFFNLAVALALILFGVTIVLMEPAAAGSGIPEVIGFLNGSAPARLMSWTTMVGKVIGVICAVGAGLCVGPEGPTIHIGALLGVGILNFCIFILDRFKKDHFLKSLRNDVDERGFVSCGAAAGIAAAFHAPIGGVLFCLEEAISFFTSKMISRVYLTCAVAYYVLYFLEDGSARFDSSTFTEFQLDLTCHISYYAQDIFWFAVLGVLGGLFGSIFNMLVINVTKLRIKFINPKGYRRVLEAVGIVLITTIVVTFVPFNYGCSLPTELTKHTTSVFNRTYYDNHEVCMTSTIWSNLSGTACPECYNHTKSDWDVAYAHDSDDWRERIADFLEDQNIRRGGCPKGQYNEMATLFYVSGHNGVGNLFKQGAYDYLHAGTIIGFGVLYFILAGITAGMSIASGLVVPMLTIGGCLGRVWGIFINEYVKERNGEHGADPGTWAMLGAAAFWSGSGRVTVTIAVIMLEITGKFRFLPAIMVTVIFAKWIGDWLTHGLYHELLHVKHIPFLSDAVPKRMWFRVFAKDIMVRDMITFRPVEDVSRIRQVLEDKAHNHNGFPVTSESDGEDALLLGVILRTQLEELVSGTSSLQVDIGRVMNETPSTVITDTTFPKTFHLFRAMGVRHLMVVDRNYHLHGLITRKDVEHALHHSKDKKNKHEHDGGAGKFHESPDVEASLAYAGDSNGGEKSTQLSSPLLEGEN